MADEASCDICPHCGNRVICAAEMEICCSGCGAVLGQDHVQQEGPQVSGLNLYQVTEVGTKKVNLWCARRMHEGGSRTSQLSNTCVKLEIPIYAARDANAIYQKIRRQKRIEALEYSSKLKDLGRLVREGIAVEGDISDLRRCRPRHCTRAHMATFAVHVVCRRYGLPRTDEQILEAVWMNFETAKKFTVLKAYSLCKPAARDMGLDCTGGTATYYARLLLSRLQGVIGQCPLYERIARMTFANLEKISGGREDLRARRAIDLAMRGARLNVQI